MLIEEIDISAPSGFQGMMIKMPIPYNGKEPRQQRG
jgi:hypothetical protein